MCYVGSILPHYREKRPGQGAYKKAQDLAAVMKVNKTSIKFFSSHVTVCNALAPSYAAGGLSHLAKLIGLSHRRVNRDICALLIP
jgi:hypothetical protein